CGVQVITGGDTLPIFTYKSYLTLINAGGYSIPNPPSGETAFINFTINNTGQALNASNNTIISYYNDVNSNGIYNVGDVLITQHTINVAIPANGTYPYSYTLNIPSGAACHYIAVIDTAMNHCSCTSSQLVLNLPLRNIAMDATMCHGQNASLGYNSITGYTYSWSPATNLNSASSSNPLISGINNGASPLTTTYVLTVNRNTCITTDTSKVIVNPVPTLTVTALNNTICAGGSTNIAISGANSYTWFPVTSLNSNTLASVIASPTANINYTVTGVNIYGCSTSSIASVVVNPLPLVSTVSNSMCAGQSATINANGAVNYTWSPSATLSSSVSPTVTASPVSTTVYSVTGTDANGCSNTATASVIVNPLPNLSTSDATICMGGSTSLSVTGANSYTWSPPTALNSSTATTVISNPTANITYSITGSDAMGCISTTLSTVIVNPVPNLSTTSSTICSGDSGTLTANGALSYSWIPAGALNTNTLATVIANPTANTTYTVIGSNAFGCSSSSVATVLVNSLPPLTASSDTICEGQSTTLVASGASNYTWSPSSSLNSSSNSTVTATPPASVVYTVTGAATNGCTVAATSTLIVNLLPSLSLASNTLCFGLTAPLTASGAATYTWLPSGSLSSGGNSLVIANPTVTTIYTVTGMSAQGCVKTLTTSVLVNNLPVLSTADATMCAGSPVNLSVSGANTYTWVPVTGLGTATGSIVSANPTTTTTYSVTGQDLNGCTSSSVSQVVVNPLPPVSVTAPSVICAGQSANLLANGAVSYTWSNSVNTPSQTVSPLLPTTYTVTGEDVNGCKKTVIQFLNVLIQPTLSISGTPTVCTGKQIYLTAMGGSGYTWDNGDTTAVISVNPFGNTNYTVSSGIVPCNSSTVFAVTVYTPAAINSYAQPPTMIYGLSSTLFGNGLSGSSYNWSGPGINCVNCSENVVSPEVSSVYTVTITDNNGCVLTNTVLVDVELICGDVFLPSGFSPNNDGFNDTWCVFGNCVKTFNLQVFNRWGEKIFESEEKDHCWDGTYSGVIQNDAVFMYQFSATLVNGQKVIKKGNVTLVR
ncbi:MAG: hypothetical protein JWO32_3111, partial [Bacteroidetes bacterium]|nr:hypothetical protein [Bacteroidota bacterium]